MLCDWCKAAVELQKLLIVGVVLHIYNLRQKEHELGLRGETCVKKPKGEKY